MWRSSNTQCCIWTSYPAAQVARSTSDQRNLDPKASSEHFDRGDSDAVEEGGE